MIFHLDRSQRTDLILFSVHITGLMSFLTIVFSFGLTCIFAEMGQATLEYAAGFSICLDAGNFLVNFLIYFALSSFIEYWSHRLFHTGFFWHLHRLHHSASSLNPLVMHRAHPANLVFDPLVRTLPIALVAIPGPAIYMLFVANTLFQLLIHSSIPWNWGWFGRWILISPAAHRIHHSANPAHYGKNFSTSLVIWDRLFGSWYAGKVQVESVGVSGCDGQNLLIDCARDLATFVREAVTAFRLRLVSQHR